MTSGAMKLLELLAAVNQLERKCKTIEAREAVPPEAYEHFDGLRAVLAKWGIDCVELETKPEGGRE